MNNCIQLLSLCGNNIELERTNERTQDAHEVNNYDFISVIRQIKFIIHRDGSNEEEEDL